MPAVFKATVRVYMSFENKDLSHLETEELWIIFKPRKLLFQCSKKQPLPPLYNLEWLLPSLLHTIPRFSLPNSDGCISQKSLYREECEPVADSCWQFPDVNVCNYEGGVMQQ